MTTVTLSVASRETVTARSLAAFEGEEQGANISFASVDLLWQTLTRKRWELLRARDGVKGADQMADHSSFRAHNSRGHI